MKNMNLTSLPLFVTSYLDHKLSDFANNYTNKLKSVKTKYIIKLTVRNITKELVAEIFI